MSSPRSWVSAKGMWKVEGKPVLLPSGKYLLLGDLAVGSTLLISAALVHCSWQCCLWGGGHPKADSSRTSEGASCQVTCPLLANSRHMQSHAFSSRDSLANRAAGRGGLDTGISLGFHLTMQEACAPRHYSPDTPSCHPALSLGHFLC